MESLASTVSFLEQEEGWRHPSAFLWRAEVADRLDLLLLGAHDEVLKARAIGLIDAMEAIDGEGFASIRDAIRNGDGRAALGPWLDVGIPSGQHYDVLDHVLAGVLAIGEPDVEQPAPPPGMVFYQPTPARHIIDGVSRARIVDSDVVLDLGAGLGHVPILVNVLTGARTLGVEREPAYVAQAMEAARGLGLHNVNIDAGDARDADMSGSSVLYLFTPFVGTVLRDVVAKIEQQARDRCIRVITLGPCTRTFARMPWLRSDDPVPSAVDRIVVFHSAPG
ncbi:methyltransferase domain-containing protein [Luteibacter sp.]|jgi:predicted RNA methylase|uniref:methyltransferase domain-containing protein n=1 Tax=Luteibacter sp. TaxID=1886636 RepID=UPI002F3EE97B